MDATGHFITNQEWPGAGASVAAVAAASGHVPTVIGKPSTRLLELISSDLGIPVQEMCVVGDRLDTDIKLAKDGQTSSILTFSGVTSLATL